MRWVYAVVLLAVSSAAFAQASGVAVSGVVCGPAGVQGVIYVSASGRAVTCGTDSSGNQLVLQVSTLEGNIPVDGGEQTGLDIGGAVLAVMAAAFGIRALRRLIESSNGDG
jgi:hypothetical protein